MLSSVGPPFTMGKKKRRREGKKGSSMCIYFLSKRVELCHRLTAIYYNHAVSQSVSAPMGHRHVFVKSLKGGGGGGVGQN